MTDHVAIMRKSWRLTEKILDGRKKIESRWYKTKHSPWGKIKKGDTVYFKNTGELVTVRGRVSGIEEFENLNPKKVREILNKYGKDDGIEKNEIPKYYQMFKDKKYCLLIFLKEVRRVKPFQINKKGFGTMASWICVEDINKIRV